MNTTSSPTDPQCLTKRFILKPCLVPALVFGSVVALLSGSSAKADTTETTWTGSGTNWSTGAGNWASGTAPSSTVSAVFNTTTGYANQPTLTAASTTQGIWDTGASGGVTTTIGGTFSLLITGTATLNSIANAGILLDGAGNNGLTISSMVTGVTTGTNTSFLVNNGGILTIAAPLTITAGTTLTLGSTLASGSGSIVINGAIQSTAGGITVNDAAGTTTVTLGGANLYTGATLVSSGTLLLNNALAAQFSTVTVSANNGLQFGTGTNTYTIGALAGAKNFALQDTSNNPITLVNGGNNTSQTFSGTLSGGGNLLKVGTGSLTLSASNTYTGTTSITGGSLILGVNAPSGSAGALGNSTSAFLLGDVTGSNNTTLATASTVAIAVGRNIIVQAGNGGTATITNSTATTSEAATFSGTITLGSSGTGHGVTLTTANVTSPSITFSGVIQDPTGLVAGTAGTLTIGTGASSTSVINITGSNTYTGNTILNQGLLYVGTFTPLGSGTLTLNGGGIGVFGGSGQSGTASLANNVVLGGNLLGVNNGGTLTLSGSVALTGNRTITVQNNALVFSGVIADSGGSNFGLTLAGATTSGAVTLSGSNTFDGGVTLAGITSGIRLNIGNLGSSTASALGTGTFTIGTSGNVTALSVNNTSGSNGTIATNNAEVWNGDFTFVGTNSLDTGTNTVSLGTLTGTTRTVTVTANTLEVDGVISNGSASPGVNSLAKAGAGTLLLTGSNTYSGTTTISAGTLSTNNLTNGGTASGIGQSSNAATNLVLSNGTLQYTGTAASTDRLFSISGTVAGVTATLDASGSGAVNFTNTGNVAFSGSTNQTRSLILTGTNTGANTLSALIADNGTGATSLTKSGVGTWVISASNSYSGTTTISGGTLNISGTGTLGAATAPLTMSGGLLDLGGTTQMVGAVSITAAPASGNTIQNGTLSGASYAASNTSGTAIVTAVLAGSGINLTKSGAGTLALTGSNTYSGTTTVSAGVLSISGANSSAGATTVSGGTLQLANTTANDGGLASGTLSLSSGTLQATSAAPLSVNNLVSLTAATTISGSQSLTLTGSLTQTANNSTLTSSITSGSLTLAGNISTGTATGSGFTFGIAGTGNTLVSGTIQDWTSGTGTSHGNLSISNSGTTTLSNVNTYTGTTTISAGTVDISGTGTIGATTAGLTMSGGLLDLGGTTQTVGAVSITGAPASGNTIQNGILTGTSFAASNTSGTATVTAVLAGSGVKLTKSGAGTLALTGSNTYTGVTTVSAGTLVLSGSTATSGIAVSDGATLRLVANAGNTTSGTSTVFGSGTLQAGSSAAPSPTFQFRSDSSVTFAMPNIIGSTAAGSFGFDVNNVAAVNGTGPQGNTLTLTGTYAPDGSGNDHASTTTVTGGNGYILSIGTVQAGGATSLVNTFNVASGLTLNIGTLSQLNNGKGHATLTFSGSGITTVASLSSIAGTEFNVNISAGTLNLTGSNNFDNATYLTTGPSVTMTGGTLNLGNAGALNVSSGTLTALIQSGGGTFDNTGTGGSAYTTLGQNITQNWNGNFTFVGSNSLNTGTGAVTIGAATTVTVNANTLKVGGIISGSSSFGLTKAGAGTLILSASDSYTGSTAVNGGILQVDGSLSGSSAVTVNAATLQGIGMVGGSVQLTGTSTLASSGTLTLAQGFSVSGSSNTLSNGTVSGNATQAAGSQFTVNGTLNGTDNLLSGASLSGNGSVGATTLNGNNTLSSAATLTVASLGVNGTGNQISSGTVNATGGTTLASNSGLAVNGTLGGSITTGSGSVLSGTGTLTGALTVSAGARTYPGSGTSAAVLTTDLAYSSGATAEFGVFSGTTPHGGNAGAGTAYDQIVVTGSSSPQLQIGAGTASAQILSGTLGSAASGVTLTLSMTSSVFTALQAGASGSYQGVASNSTLNNYYVFSLGSGTLDGRFQSLDLIIDGTDEGAQTILYGGTGYGRFGSGPGITNTLGDVTVDGQEFAISYTGNYATNSTIGGSDIVLTAIPEPGTWGMILSGFGMLIGIQKLRKRRVGT